MRPNFETIDSKAFDVAIQAIKENNSEKFKKIILGYSMERIGTKRAYLKRDKNGDTILHHLAKSNILNDVAKDKIFEDILENSNLNTPNAEGNTPIHLALMSKQKIPLILKLGSKENIDVPNKKNQKPYDILRQGKLSPRSIKMVNEFLFKIGKNELEDKASKAQRHQDLFPIDMEPPSAAAVENTSSSNSKPPKAKFI